MVNSQLIGKNTMIAAEYRAAKTVRDRRTNRQTNRHVERLTIKLINLNVLHSIALLFYVRDWRAYKYI